MNLEPPPSQDTPVDHPQFRQWLYALWEKTVGSSSSVISEILGTAVSFIQAGLGAVTRTMQDKARERFSVKDFGAVGDGFTDDSIAFANAFAAANKELWTPVGNGYPITTAELYIPPGNYIVRTGLTASTLNCSIVGAGRENVQIQIGAGQYFVTATTKVPQFTLSGISFSGGAGIVKYSSSAVNVQGHINIRDNNFFGYTECALTSFSVDFPYWKIYNNIFYGTTTSKGIALDGLVDQSEIANNSFLLNRYSVKLGQGGNNAKLFDNDFLRFTNGGGSPILVDVWIVPNPFNGGLGYINSGEGFHSFSNKYGNENLNAADIRVLYADEAAGTNFATKNHATTVSTGFITGHSFERDFINGVSNMTRGFIYSYTPNVRDIKISEVFGSAKYPFVLQYDAGVTFSEDRLNTLNALDLSQTVDWPETPTPNWSNYPGAGTVIDPFGLLSGQASHVNDKSGADAGFTSLVSASLPVPLMSLALATRGVIEDAVSDYNAGDITYSSASGVIFASSAAATAGRRCWIEFDVQTAIATPLTSVRLDVYSSGTVTPILRRFVAIPTTWQTVRFSFVPSISGSLSIQFFPGDYVAGTKTRVYLGRVRVYHASDPSDAGSIFKQARAAWTPGAIAAGGRVTTAVLVPGAAFGDLAVASFNLALGGLTISAESTTNIVNVTIANNTGGIVTLGAGTVLARVYKDANP